MPIEKIRNVGDRSQPESEAYSALVDKNTGWVVGGGGDWDLIRGILRNG